VNDFLIILFVTKKQIYGKTDLQRTGNSEIQKSTNEPLWDLLLQYSGSKKRFGEILLELEWS
jgi:hypothetical protein